VAAIPLGVAASWLGHGLRLLDGVFAGVPAAFVLGIAAVLAARKARARFARTLARPGEDAARVGRLLGLVGAYLGVTGGLALAVYAILRLAS